MSARRFVQVAVGVVGGLMVIVALTDDGKLWRATLGGEWKPQPEAPQDPEVADVAF